MIFAFFAFSLRGLCVWGARGSERLWEGWTCNKPRRCCIVFASSLRLFCIFYALSLRLGRPRLREALTRLDMQKHLGGVALFLHLFALFLHCLCVVFASWACVLCARGAERLWERWTCKNTSEVLHCVLHVLCGFCIFCAFFFFFFAFFAHFCVVFTFVCVVFAYSLRCLCVWGDRGSESLWEGWTCKKSGRYFIFFALLFFSFSLRLFFHVLGVVLSFSLRLLRVPYAGARLRRRSWACSRNKDNRRMQTSATPGCKKNAKRAKPARTKIPNKRIQNAKY